MDARIYKQLKDTHEHLKRNYAKERKELNAHIQILQNQNTILKNHNTDLQSLLNVFDKQNKKVFRQYFLKQYKAPESSLQVKVVDVCIDFENMFYFMKYFEMHIADLLIDQFYTFRLVDALNDSILKRLFADCHSFTNEIITKQTLQVYLKVQQLKDAINFFKKQEALKILSLIKEKNIDKDVVKRVENAFDILMLK